MFKNKSELAEELSQLAEETMVVAYCPKKLSQFPVKAVRVQNAASLLIFVKIKLVTVTKVGDVRPGVALTDTLKLGINKRS